jgi:Putative zinc-finger
VSGRDHVHDELGGYVLGALEPDEAEAVREHLARCADCSREHARLAGLPALLSLAGHAGAAAAPPPAVEERVLDAVARERTRPAPRRRWRRPVPLAAGLATAALALVALALVLGRDDAAQGYPVTLRPVSGASAAGRAELESVAGGTTVRLWVRDLPPDPGIVYEVRCDAPGWSASAGTFRADTRGRAYVVLTTAARRGEYDALRVVRRARTSSTDVLTASLN